MGLMDKVRDMLKMGKPPPQQQTGGTAGDPYMESRDQGDRSGGTTGQPGEQPNDAGSSPGDTF